MNPLRNNYGQRGNMLQQFLQFKNSMQGKDPKQVYGQLISSGKYTQEQIAWAKQQAEQFKNFLK